MHNTRGMYKQEQSMKLLTHLVQIRQQERSSPLFNFTQKLSAEEFPVTADTPLSG